MRPSIGTDPLLSIGEMVISHEAGDPFELVLLDAHMPGLSGFDVARQIRENTATQGVPLLMLSSVDLTAQTRFEAESTVDLYLVKPVARAELQGAILKVMGQPDAAAPVAIPAMPIPVIAPASTAGDPTRALRVLLAEDNKVNQRLAIRLLEKRGHHVTVADDGKAALAAYASQPFDIILMDVQMPEIDGLEATRTLRPREAPTGKHMPIIALTAHAMSGDRERCIAAGMDDYVTKPIQRAELYQKIDALLKPSVMA